MTHCDLKLLRLSQTDRSSRSLSVFRAGGIASVMSKVEKIYRKQMVALGGMGRTQRTADLFEVGRSVLEARALRRDATLTGDRLNIAIARLMYWKDPVILKLLDQHEALEI